MRASATFAVAMALVLCFSVSPANAANSIAVTNAAAIEGTFGLEVTLDGTNTDAYVRSDHPTDEKTMTWRFWVAPGPGLTMTNQTSFRFARTNNADGGSEGQNVIHFLRRGTGNSFRLNTWVKDGDGIFKFVGGFFLTNSPGNVPREIEVTWTASDPGQNNGSITVTRLDNNATATRTGLTNETHDIDVFRVGAFVGGNPGGATGTYYFDSYESFR